MQLPRERVWLRRVQPGRQQRRGLLRAVEGPLAAAIAATAVAAAARAATAVAAAARAAAAVTTTAVAAAVAAARAAAVAAAACAAAATRAVAATREGGLHLPESDQLQPEGDGRRRLVHLRDNYYSGHDCGLHVPEGDQLQS